MYQAEVATAPPEQASPILGQPDRQTALAFIADDETDAALRGGLADVLGNVQIRRGGIRAAIRHLEQEHSPYLLIADISGIEAPVAALEALALVCAPDTKVVVLGDRTDIEFYRDVTKLLGVNEYMAKPLTRDGVARLIEPYLMGSAPARAADQGGRVVTVCGARGGVGATTVTVNLALQIAEQTRAHVALLDLHLRGGHAAMMLGGQPGAGLRLALENPERADTLFLERVGIPFGERLHVIAAEEPFSSDPAVSVEGVEHLMALLRQRFNVIVVDLPTPPGPAERAILRIARQVLVVFGPEVASIRDAEQMRRVSTELTGAGRTMMVLNRAGVPGGLKQKLIEEALGSKPEAIIPDLPRVVPQAINMGRPALRKSTALQRALAPLTQEISGVGQKLESGGRLRRLFHR